MNRSQCFSQPDCVGVLVVSSFLWLAASVCNPSRSGERLALEVREVAGLARVGYPAHALLKLSRPVGVSTRFRLLHEDKPVVAQFRPGGEGATAQWWLDFQTE